MPNPAKQIVLGAALLVGITMVANADPMSRTGGKSAASGAAVPSGARQLSGNQLATLPPPDATPTRDSIKLPSISVVAPYSHPYTSGLGPKASPNGRVRAEHYRAPPDYVTNIAMHPYTSHIGPKAGPNDALRVPHYEVPADYEAHVAMHPYSSGMGPPTDSPRNRQGDLRGVAVTHANR
jgi:hypothetical protein